MEEFDDLYMTKDAYKYVLLHGMQCTGLIRTAAQCEELTPPWVEMGPRCLPIGTPAWVRSDASH